MAEEELYKLSGSTKEIDDLWALIRKQKQAMAEEELYKLSGSTKEIDDLWALIRKQKQAMKKVQQ